MLRNKPSLLPLLMLVLLAGCQGSKCITVVDESGKSADPSRIYLLDSGEYLAEISNPDPVLITGGKGVLIGESENGEVCFSNEKEGLFGGYYRLEAPWFFVYENDVQYFTSFDDVPSVIVLKKKEYPDGLPELPATGTPSRPPASNQ